MTTPRDGAAVTLGIDIGTSGVKAILLDGDDRVVAEASAVLRVHRPQPLWSEQDPDDWWRATNAAVHSLREQAPRDFAALRGVGLSGQMHGATLLDAHDRPLRPAILWNDGRSAAECRQLEEAVPDSREITGNLAMPGFTAPKLLWVRQHEPELFARTARVLLPKDYVRLCMSGDRATDLSDASGTLWVDVARRRWSERMIAASGLGIDAMPKLYEGPEVTGRLRAEVAGDWGCERVPVVAGAGDNAAGAIGAGVVEPGRAFLSLGTSGVYFVASDAFRPNAERAVHAFCHALPDQWHQMSVLLSAASCLHWVTRLTGAPDEAALLDEIATRDQPSRRLLFLPYLSGERTPHNDPNASGVFVGLDHETDRASLGRAVLEGVAFAFADAEQVLRDSGSRIDAVSVIGGGARSALWGRILASVLGRPLVYRRGGDLGPACGAARLARLGVVGGSAREVCSEPPEDFVAEPDPALAAHYAERIPRFRSLYHALREPFRSEAEHPQEAGA
jgi:xylulokinase